MSQQYSGIPFTREELDDPDFNGGLLCPYCNKIQDKNRDCQDCEAWRALNRAIEDSNEPMPDAHIFSMDVVTNLFMSRGRSD